MAETSINNEDRDGPDEGLLARKDEDQLDENGDFFPQPDADSEDAPKKSCCFIADLFRTYDTGFLACLGLQYFNSGTQVMLELAWLNMFKNTFEGKIVDVIKKTVKKEVETKLPGDLNTLLSKNDGFVAIPGFENWWLDFMSEEGGVITDTSIEQGIRGIMFDHS